MSDEARAIKRLMIIGMVLFIIAIGAPFVYARYSECSALEILIKTPVSAPANPAQSPTKEATYQLYLGLVHWARLDAC